ncbi:hypothetical protein LCGC14_0612910 [marine sediment metagenome]|uniref:Uncharacterized protein n=1 Tax=marine sediment metagenome TaxID=412755 RepID=A0A0F9RBV1_9ZZZZ
MIINITEYVQPNGHEVIRELKVADIYAAQYKALVDCGCILTCEALMSGVVVSYISHEEGDFMTRITPPSVEEGTKDAIIEMLSCFDSIIFEAWLSHKQGQEIPTTMAVPMPKEILGLPNPFPDGKLNESDEGVAEIAIAIEETRGKVIMAFAAPTMWLAMTPDEASAIADDLMNKAQTLREAYDEQSSRV